MATRKCRGKPAAGEVTGGKPTTAPLAPSLSVYSSTPPTPLSPGGSGSKGLRGHTIFTLSTTLGRLRDDRAGDSVMGASSPPPPLLLLPLRPSRKVRVISSCKDQ